MSIEDELKRILSGESIDEAIENLIEADVNDVRGALGAFKKELRAIAALGEKGFAKTISGYQSPPRLKYAQECDAVLKAMVKSFLAPPPVRAGELIKAMNNVGDRKQLTQLLDNDPKTLAMKLNRAGCNDTLLTAGIRLSDAGEKLYLALTADD